MAPWCLGWLETDRPACDNELLTLDQPLPARPPCNTRQITKFNSSTEAILREGEEFLEDIELAEGNVQQAYLEYRDQVRMGTAPHHTAPHRTASPPFPACMLTLPPLHPPLHARTST